MGKKRGEICVDLRFKKELMYMTTSKKLFYHYLSFILLGGLVGLAGCKDNEELASDDSIQVAATKSITVVFAPGQLGDMGYADNVMEGIYYLKMRDLVTESGACDVSFTMGESIDMTQEHLKTWFDSISNPRNNVAYEQRLLVLTEPYMLDWIEPMTENMRPTDEVLVMKVNAADVSAAAQRLGLGNRLHGLNISAAESARRYCQYIKETVEEEKRKWQEAIESGQASADDSYVPLNCDTMIFYRLYAPGEVTYRDSVYEVLSEELAGMADIEVKSMASTVGDGIFSDDGNTSILQQAYRYGMDMEDMLNGASCGFHLADLGAATQGLRYYFMGKASITLKMLVLDTKMDNHFWVCREFGFALCEWCYEWVNAAEVGAMPAQQEFGDWNSSYVRDNYIALSQNDVPTVEEEDYEY